MDPLQFFAASRLVVVAGKGGVGKTTVTAVLARAAAECGLRVLVLDVEGKAGLAGLLGGERDELLGYEACVLATGVGADGRGEIHGRSITPGTALVEYLEDHGMRRVSRRLADAGILDVVSTAAPGIEDILVLGKVKQIERAHTFDLLVLDGPAAGHALGFLRSARGLLDSVGVGPIRTQARDVLEMLQDPQRCQVVLVTLAEETPVNELVETSDALEDEVGTALGPVIVNAVMASLDPDAVAVAGRGNRRTMDGALDAARFRIATVDHQRAQIGRLGEALPLPQLHLPFRFTAGIDRNDVDELVRVLLDEIAGVPA